MSVREFSRRIFTSLWRGVYPKDQKGIRQQGSRCYRTLEIERQLPAPQANNCGGRWGNKGTRKSFSDRGWSYETFSSLRRTLIDNVLRRVTNTQASSLRRRAAEQLTGRGNSAPFLALVGVSLASGSGIITKEDEIEGVCYEIRRAVSGTPLLDQFKDVSKEKEETDAMELSLKDFLLGKVIAKGCSAVVYTAKQVEQKDDDFNLAIKMMFNYDAASNALTILRAMQREIVPARNVCLPRELSDSAAQIGEMVRVPPHPNIVEVLSVFADKVPGLPGDLQLYGDALPTRLNPGGSGRNMSLFLVMRRYDCSLRDYLLQYREEINSRISTVLLAQLLEGIAFLEHNGVAHRDLKTDNILVDLAGGPEHPRLVISDFGCCLADKNTGLRLPYRTYDTDKGGNPALMAPEVALAVPGTFTNINYEKADLWSVGTIAYEIFRGDNPFYSSETTTGLQSRTYSMTELPELTDAPPMIGHLVRSMLKREPQHRPSPRQAATIVQLLLWSPSAWIKESKTINSQEILQWLLTMTTKVLCESRWGNSSAALQEYQLVATFLATMSMQDIRASIHWIQDQLED